MNSIFTAIFGALLLLSNPAFAKEKDGVTIIKVTPCKYDDKCDSACSGFNYANYVNGKCTCANTNPCAAFAVPGHRIPVKKVKTKTKLD